METTTFATETIDHIRELLADVTDGYIRRFATTLSPIKKGESSIGSIHNEETKRLFVLARRLDKLEDQTKAQAELADDEEQKAALIAQTTRYGMYYQLIHRMAWCQIHEELGGFWEVSVSLRENWVIVRIKDEPNPMEALQDKIRHALLGGGRGFIVDTSEDEE